jgi:hypothetical protein
MLWMAAFGVALFLFFACPPVRRRTVRAARACWSQIRAKLPHGAAHPARRPSSSHRPVASRLEKPHPVQPQCFELCWARASDAETYA